MLKCAFLVLAAGLLVLPVEAQPPANEGSNAWPSVCERAPQPAPDPKPKETFRADYPSKSIRNREQGEAVISMCVREDGSVSDVKIVKSTGYPRLDEASLKQVRNLRFHPATDACGKPIAWCDPPYQMKMAWRLPGL